MIIDCTYMGENDEVQKGMDYMKIMNRGTLNFCDALKSIFFRPVRQAVLYRPGPKYCLNQGS